jgi:hypothetical protein
MCSFRPFHDEISKVIPERTQEIGRANAAVTALIAVITAIIMGSAICLQPPTAGGHGGCLVTTDLTGGPGR